MKNALTANIALLIVLSLTGAPVFAGEAKTQAPATIPLEIKGMTCPVCERPVRKALEKLDGVEKASVSFWKGKAVVTYDPSKVTPEQMVEAVNKRGYKASLKSAGENR